MTSISTINVPFHGDNLYLVSYEGQPFVAMRPFIENMGLDWASQYTKIKQRFKTCVVNITMQLPCDNQRRSVVCLALKKLTGWLHTININKVRPEIRDKVAAYQDKSDDVLYEYWTTGEVKKKPNFRQSTAKELIPLRQTAERLIAHGVGNIYPDIWKRVHAEFGVQHINELLPEQIPLAISYLDALEGEYIPKQQKIASLSADKERDIYNVNALAKQYEAIYTAWKVDLYPALVSMDSPIAKRLYDRFKTGYAFLMYLQTSLNGKHPALIN
ncbi:phage antirepressor N-terminal domain-containing protein [Morganella morganii]|uniref:phage antirepressor N-terminal domain-containing protein n=1 Tax=Morganella morganii TaxID=582 RepID=UPI0009B8EC09|nr:phage antirepressor N-terminal domain-containing protein [Morganella morganii]